MLVNSSSVSQASNQIAEKYCGASSVSGSFGTSTVAFRIWPDGDVKLRLCGSASGCAGPVQNVSYSRAPGSLSMYAVPWAQVLSKLAWSKYGLVPLAVSFHFMHHPCTTAGVEASTVSAGTIAVTDSSEPLWEKYHVPLVESVLCSCSSDREVNSGRISFLSDSESW